jgi:formylglycine-generating enzyme required for sulfatase activity/tRNA A-37 threonylcarbamoyl transferase component Bud32
MDEATRKQFFAALEKQRRLRQAGTASDQSEIRSVLDQLGVGKEHRADPSALDLPPELRNHPLYEVQRELGRGGMGVVYLAKNKIMDRLEVLKVINKKLLDRPGAMDRFLREIRSAAKLSHPNVVIAYNALPLGDLLVFGMEYVPGEDLAQVVKNYGGPLPVLNACYYTQQVVLGLQAAFEKGMVHRDIKPHNLILAKDGNKHIVKILDFGLAKARSEGKTQHQLTATGQMMGTPDYMPPEQWLDAAHADIRADIYSLGCTLYYLLAGSAPFKGDNLPELWEAHRSRPPQPLNEVRSEVPAALAAVVAKMLAKKPAERYQTPIEVAQALLPFLNAATRGPSVVETKARPQGVRQVTVEAFRRETVTEGRSTLGGACQRLATELVQRPSAFPMTNRRWLLLVASLATVLLMLSIGLWAGGALKVTTKYGTIVLQNLPDEAEVVVDGERVKVKLENGKAIEIAAGKKHQLQVKMEGFKVWAKEVEIDSGGRLPISVRLEPLLPVPAAATNPAPQAPEPPNTSAQPGKAPLVSPAANANKETSPAANANEAAPSAPIASKAAPPSPIANKDKKITNSIGMDLVLIPAGKFLMGSPKDEAGHSDEEGPQHEVEITHDFYLGKYDVTRGQFRAFVNDTGYKTEAEKDGKGGWGHPGWKRSPKYNWRDLGFVQTDEHPVVNVTWNDAKAFCAWLSRKEDRTYRLPTEAEWEFACRAGTTTRFWFGDDERALARHANVADASFRRAVGTGLGIVGDDGYAFTAPVGRFAANPWGLYDMHGNVWQWCEDYYGPYQGLKSRDPLRQEKDKVDCHVLRGGSWDTGSAGDFRAAFRCWSPRPTNYSIGFRLCFRWTN